MPKKERDMATEYAVSLDAEDSNALANNLSLGGRVNGIAVAVVIHLSAIEGKTPKEAKLIKQRALIGAFISKHVQLVGVEGDKVTL